MRYDLAAAENGPAGMASHLACMARWIIWQNTAPKRSRPAELLPGTLRVVSLRMNCMPPDTRDSWQVLAEGERAFISRYALGRDYHKVMRNRLRNWPIKSVLRSLNSTDAYLPIARSVGGGIGAQGRNWLARQAHLAVVARTWLAVFSRRDLCELTAAGR